MTNYYGDICKKLASFCQPNHSNAGWEKIFSYMVFIAAITSGVLTVASWTESSEFGPDPDIVLIILYVDTILLLFLGLIVVRQLLRVWAGHRRGLAGSGLHIRIVILFSLVAVTPAILVAIFSVLFLNFGIQAWFNSRVRTAVEASSAVAQAYLGEHRQSIRAEAFAMANDLNREAPVLMRDLSVLDELLGTQARLRSLSEAIVVDGSGRIIASAPLSLTLELDLIPWRAIEQAERGQVAVLSTERDDRVRAAIKLNRFIDAYLVIGRFLDTEILSHIDMTEIAVNQYRMLEQRREGIFISFAMVFLLVALLLLLAAVWMGVNLATHISRPMSSLVAAAERVRDGDLSVRISATSIGEFAMVGRAFNRMTSQLQAQQEGLLLTNRDLDERRRFTEAVLSGVSAGVIGLDSQANINLPNRSATELLSVDLTAARGMSLVDVVPEMGELISNAIAQPERLWESEIKLIRGGQPRTLILRIVAERLEREVVGYVVTFDDITALVQAERTAAWADIARRIAHEIKNPLTPIQLASERLKRKYAAEIKTDPNTFFVCIETIIRQVQEIGRMVDEFSCFARMPRPEAKAENICNIVKQTVIFESNREPGINIEVSIPDQPLIVLCDGRQISQALVNILKNSTEAIAGRDSNETTPGWIKVMVRQERNEGLCRRILVRIEDNGKGLPKENRDRLTEPYITTRAKGTGLGLAIVKKIIEDHSATLSLEDRDGGGARVSIIFNEFSLVTASFNTDMPLKCDINDHSLPLDADR